MYKLHQKILFFKVVDKLVECGAHLVISEEELGKNPGIFKDRSIFHERLKITLKLKLNFILC